MPRERKEEKPLNHRDSDDDPVSAGPIVMISFGLTAMAIMGVLATIPA